MARDNRLAYERENTLARSRGFRNAYEQRKHKRRPSTRNEYGVLPERAREVRSDAIEAIDLARKEHISPEEAAERLRVPWSAVRWWGDESLGHSRGGRTELTRRTSCGSARSPSGIPARPTSWRSAVGSGKRSSASGTSSGARPMGWRPRRSSTGSGAAQSANERLPTPASSSVRSHVAASWTRSKRIGRWSHEPGRMFLLR